MLGERTWYRRVKSERFTLLPLSALLPAVAGVRPQLRALLRLALAVARSPSQSQFLVPAHGTGLVRLHLGSPRAPVILLDWPAAGKSRGSQDCRSPIGCGFAWPGHRRD